MIRTGGVDPVKVLTVSNCPPDPSLGSGQVIRSYTEGLRESAHTVDFLGPDDYELLQHLRPCANSYRQALGMWLSCFAQTAGPRIRRC